MEKVYDYISGRQNSKFCYANNRAGNYDSFNLFIIDKSRNHHLERSKLIKFARVTITKLSYRDSTETFHILARLKFHGLVALVFLFLFENNSINLPYLTRWLYSARYFSNASGLTSKINLSHHLFPSLPFLKSSTRTFRMFA